MLRRNIDTLHRMVNSLTLLLAGGTSLFPDLEVNVHHLSTSKVEHVKHSNAKCSSSLATLRDYDIKTKRWRELNH